MTISIIIVNFNGTHYTRQCLESFYRFHPADAAEVIVVDNNSHDGSRTELEKLYPSLNVIKLDENRGFGGANNEGAKKATGEILFFVNNDTLFLGESLSNLANVFALDKTIGIVGPQLLNEDKSFQLSFGDFPTIRTELTAMNISRNESLALQYAPVSVEPQKKEWITGAALMIKSELFERAGGFDERYFMYFEDIDLCKTIHTYGHQIMFLPSVSLVHFGGKSYGKNDTKILKGYRFSQLHYYDKQNSMAQRILIRVYLFFKYAPKTIISKNRSVALTVLKNIFQSNK